MSVTFVGLKCPNFIDFHLLSLVFATCFKHVFVVYFQFSLLLLFTEVFRFVFQLFV